MNKKKLDPFHISPDISEHGNLAGKYSRVWVESAFDVENKINRRLGVQHTKNYLGTSVALPRLAIFLGIIFAVILIIIARIIYLQIINGVYYRNLAEGNRVRLQPILAERGIIFDSFGRELVSNIPNFSLVITPRDLPRTIQERNKIIDQISALSKIPSEDINKILIKYKTTSYETITIKENLDYTTALKLYVENAVLPGVSIQSGTKRNYITDQSVTSTQILSLSHILGYLGKTEDTFLNSSDLSFTLAPVGKTGVEKIYEANLRGLHGKKKIEVNALGKEQNILAVDPPKPGDNLFLTIDLDAQKKLEEIVKNTAQKIGKQKISAIALNPHNGRILALVSWPSYNNNLFAGGISSESYNNYIQNTDLPLFNRAISGVYPSGSTAKLMVAAAALQEKIITRATTFNSVGGLQVGDRFFKDWKTGGHGATNVVKALAWSVNTFFYYIGGGYKSFVGLGSERLLHYLALFNLARPTGIDLPGEASGFLPSKIWKKQTKKELWYVGDTYNISIGQGDLLVTPLQVAVWTAAFANNGAIIKPHIAEKIVNPTTNAVLEIPDEVLKAPFISPENIAIVKQGMRECVVSGSCKLLQTLPFPTAGKTGTAQWSQNKSNHAWFTSFAPYNNPQIVVTVLVEEGGEGSAVALPIARDFLAWWGKKYYL